ncbi:MAG: hypothetical protein GKR93_02460 [Gammaproteobacteria bacterium]|nr:hypothetical protein [Gammaproteobacteria bacterium]
MNILVKRLSVILCSGFFFPVSCTIGTAVSLPVIQHFDTRDIAKDDEPHIDSFVLANSQSNTHKVRLKDLHSYKKNHPQASFLLKEGTGVVEPDDYTTISYEVIRESENRQTIEVTLRDDDGHVSVQYEVEGRDIRPLYTRGYFNSYAFLALRNGIILAFFLYLLGRFLPKLYN